MQKKPAAQNPLPKFFLKNKTKILLAIFFLALIFRIFSIVVVPEPAYNDSVYHLEVAQQFMQGNFPTQETPPFLYHIILAGFFGFTGLPMVWPFVKVIPLLVALLQIGIAFLLFKKVFPKSYLIPTIFFVSFPWIVRMGSVNMVDSFSVLAVVVFAYFAYRLAESTTSKLSMRYALLSALSFLPMAFSKTNVIFIIPFMLICFGLLLREKLGVKKALPLFVFAIVFGASFVLISATLPFGSANPLESGAPSIRNLPLPQLNLINFEFFPKSFAVFFDFPHESSFDKMPILGSLPYFPVLVIFILILLPLGFLIIKGAYVSAKRAITFAKSLFLKTKEKRSDFAMTLFWLMALLCFLASIYPSLTAIRESEIYVRYLLPALPFIALLVGLAYERSSVRLRQVALVSILLFAFYSFAMTSTSAMFYYNVQQKNMPLYDYLNASSDIPSIISMLNSRALRYYTNKEVITLPMGTYALDEIIHDYGGESKYFAISCYNEDLMTSIPELQSSPKVQTVFENGCTKVLKIIS